MRKEWIISAVLVLTGCGIQHQNVRLSLPSPQVNQPNGKPIVLSSVTDSRGAHADLKLSANDRTHNVGGVMRGGSGIAVDLADTTVTDEMRSVITQSLRGMGYKVINNSEATTDTPRVAADITKLDASMPMNFFRAMTYSQKMLADIATNVTVTSGKATQSFTVSGHGENIYQRVVPENWEVALNRAVADYIKKLQEAMIIADQSDSK
jgi:hypothetical protein